MLEKYGYTRIEPDPDKIEEVISVLREAWLSAPHQRLGQLIFNAIHYSERCEDLFVIPDEHLVEGLRRFQRKGAK